MKRDGLLPTVTVYYMCICSQRMLHLSDAGARPTRLTYTYMNDFLCWSRSGHLKSIVIIIRIGCDCYVLVLDGTCVSVTMHEFTIK